MIFRQQVTSPNLNFQGHLEVPWKVSWWWWWGGGKVGRTRPIIIITLHSVESSWVELDLVLLLYYDIQFSPKASDTIWVMSLLSAPSKEILLIRNQALLESSLGLNYLHPELHQTLLPCQFIFTTPRERSRSRAVLSCQIKPKLQSGLLTIFWKKCLKIKQKQRNLLLKILTTLWDHWTSPAILNKLYQIHVLTVKRSFLLSPSLFLAQDVGYTNTSLSVLDKACAPPWYLPILPRPVKPRHLQYNSVLTHQPQSQQIRHQPLLSPPVLPLCYRCCTELLTLSPTQYPLLFPLL